jgi:AbrB family looped-hinge helix DNA binding protein
LKKRTKKLLKIWSKAEPALDCGTDRGYLTFILPRAVRGMAGTTTRVSTKGQVILPAELRTKRGWQAGQVLEVQETPEGVLLKAAPMFARTTVDQVAGMLGSPEDGRTRTIEDMHQAVVEEARRRRARGRY